MGFFGKILEKLGIGGEAAVPTAPDWRGDPRGHS